MLDLGVLTRYLAASILQGACSRWSWACSHSISLELFPSTTRKSPISVGQKPSLSPKKPPLNHVSIAHSDGHGADTKFLDVNI
jgi:hypothetical protein